MLMVRGVRWHRSPRRRVLAALRAATQNQGRDMSAPKRIQRKRTKGWRMPKGAVYVGRPTKWGNPYNIGDPAPITGDPMDRADVVEAYRFEASCADIFNGAAYTKEVQRVLRGKDLACWCPLDQPCHADVLLDIANRATS